MEKLKKLKKLCKMENIILEYENLELDILGIYLKGFNMPIIISLNKNLCRNELKMKKVLDMLLNYHFNTLENKPYHIIYNCDIIN